MDAVAEKTTGTDQVPIPLHDWRTNDDESGHWIEDIELSRSPND